MHVESQPGPSSVTCSNCEGDLFREIISTMLIRMKTLVTKISIIIIGLLIAIIILIIILMVIIVLIMI